VITLKDKETGKLIGEISEDQLQFLINELEEEDSKDADYYLNRATIEMLKERGMDGALTDLLYGTLGERDEIEIGWSRD
jgi:hypothetical protein